MSPAAKTGRKGSIRNQLLVGVLLLALVPLLLVSEIGYQIASSSLRDAALEGLQETSSDNERFILNWFDYRFMDVDSLASDPATSSLLGALSDDFFDAEVALKEYVRSYDWEVLVGKHRSHFFNQWLAYDYLYDIFLVDLEGNIMMSLTREDDLGTNIYTGPYSETLFAGVVRTTLEQGRTELSDFERYGPSNNVLSAFFSAPVLDHNGLRIGALAMQVRLDRVQQSLRMDSAGWSSNYLVGTDGLMRTAVYDENTDVLIKKIDSPLFYDWLDAVESNTVANRGVRMQVGYPGLDGKPVIGVSVPLQIGSVQWLLVSERNQDVALSAAARLADVVLILLLITGFVVVLVTYRLSGKLSEPILRLKQVSRKATSGALDQNIDIDANNEIGELADIFQTMLDARRNHEEKLQESNFRLEQVVDATSVGIWNWDIETNAFSVSDRWVEMLGYSVEELSPMSVRLWRSLAHSGDLQRVDQMLEQYFSGERDIYECEFRMKHKDGGWIWIYDSGKAVAWGPKGEPLRMIGSHVEITQRKQGELELIKAKEAAEAGARAKSEFLASMSHEIRTPMNGVLGMLGFLSRGDLSATQKHQVNLAVTSAESLLVLINDILDFSKIEAGKLDIEAVDFDLVRLLGDFVEFEAQKAQQKGIEVVLDFSGIKQSMVKGDPGRIRQVLSNLVGNASKFTERGEITVRASLQDFADEGLLFSCSVADTGVGIAKEKLSSIFGSFSQVDSSTTRQYGGTGLGLSIARQLCLLMGGDIQVSSTVGQGSTFSFNVFLQQSDEKKFVTPDADLTGLPMLVVDDSDTSRSVLRTQLEIWGAEVEEAASAEQALNIMMARDDAGQPNFRVAFVDMDMPVEDGFGLGCAIRENPRFNDVAMVMMSSMANRGSQKSFTRAGYNAYFPKPVTLSDLLSTLTLVLSQHQQFSPVKAAPEQEAVDRPPLSGVEAFKPSSRWPENTRVLVVEDNHINQEVVKIIFDELGLPSDIVDNGEEALQALQKADDKRPYAMIFMDCQMPKMDGYAATRAIRNGQGGGRNKKIPIVAMTANAMKGDREKCLSTGMDDYISKPIGQGVLEDRAEHWLLGSKLTATGVEGRKLSSKKMDREPVNDQVIWDQQRALTRVKGKPERLAILVDMFLKNMPPLMAELQAALAEGELVTVTDKAHAIKGVAGNLSINQLMGLAAEVEQQAKNNSLDGVQVLMGSFGNVFEQSLEELRGYL